MRAKAVVRNNRIPCGWKYAHGNVWSMFWPETYYNPKESSRRRHINLTAQCLVLLSVDRPSLEYGSEIWESQARALESILLGGEKKILGCSSKMCNEAVWGDMGLDTRRDRAKVVV